MEFKSNQPAAGAAPKQSAAVLKIKTNKFLISYFNYLILALGAIITVGGLFILVYPKYQQIAKTNKEIRKNLLVGYEAKSDYLNSVRNLKKSYQSISDGDKAKIDVMAPNQSDAGAIITEIESIAASNSAILNSIRIEPVGSGRKTEVEVKENKEPSAGLFNQPPAGAGLIKIEVKLSAVDYQVLKNIIKTFENNLRLFDIAKINFNVSENQALLNIYSYYLK